MAEITSDGKVIRVRIPYSISAVEKLRKAGGGRWNPGEKCWIFPFSSGREAELRGLFVHSIKDSKHHEILTDLTEIDNYRKIIKKLQDSILLRGYSCKTEKAYVLHGQKYLEYCIKEKTQPSADSAEKYLLRICRERKLSCSYVNQCISAFKYLFINCLNIPSEGFRLCRVKNQHKLPPVLSCQEISILMQSITNLKHKTILAVIYSSGLRISEAANLKAGDIDTDRMNLHVRQGKGQKDRITVLSKKAAEMIMIYRQQYMPVKWLFPGQLPLNHISTRSIEAFFNNALKKSGIEKDATVHTLRHSFATHLLENGTDIRYIQQLLGHKNLKTTSIYTHITSWKINNIVSPFDL